MRARDRALMLSAGAAHHGFEVIVGFDDLDQPVLGRAVAAIGVGMMLLHQRLVFRLHRFQRRIAAQAHHLQRLALGIEHLAGFRLGLFRAGTRTWPPAAAAVELAEHRERIGGAVQISLGGLAFALGAVGAHLPGRAMAGQRVLLVARDGIGVHAGEEIIRLVVLADMVQAEVPVFLVVGAALGGAVLPLVLAVGPLAQNGLLARAGLLLRALLVGLDADAVEEF